MRPAAAGFFGRNSQYFAGGRDATQLNALLADGRRDPAARSTDITPDDLQSAVLSFADLHVARAHELAAGDCDLPGTRRLVVMATIQSELAQGGAPKTPALLAAVERRLKPHLLAGERLIIVAPRYVALGVEATLRIAAAANPTLVEEEARHALPERFVDSERGKPIWTLSRDVGTLIGAGWLRKLPAVLSMPSIRLLRDGEVAPDRVSIGHLELPRFMTAP